jgi:hypothetical protein
MVVQAPHFVDDDEATFDDRAQAALVGRKRVLSGADLDHFSHAATLAQHCTGREETVATHAVQRPRAGQVEFGSV